MRLLERIAGGEEPAPGDAPHNAEAEKALEIAREEAKREFQIREKARPQLVRHILENLTRHKRAIPSKFMTRGGEGGQYVLKEPYRFPFWTVEATIPSGKDWVVFEISERYVAKADADARFEEVREIMRSRQKHWDKRFECRKELPDTVSEEWEPPGLPFPEEGMQVQRRVVFRWNVDFTIRRYTDTITSMSIVQFRHPTPEDPDAYSGYHVLQMILLTKDFR